MKMTRKAMKASVRKELAKKYEDKYMYRIQCMAENFQKLMDENRELKEENRELKRQIKERQVKYPRVINED